MNEETYLLCCMHERQSRKWLQQVGKGRYVAVFREKEGERKRLNRLHSFKWELFPYPVELKKNNEGI